MRKQGPGADLAALVLVLRIKTKAQINDYLDALHYTVSTVTTAGFGEIVLIGA